MTWRGAFGGPSESDATLEKFSLKIKRRGLLPAFVFFNSRDDPARPFFADSSTKPTFLSLVFQNQEIKRFGC
jgi:hypothetical protein